MRTSAARTTFSMADCAWTLLGQGRTNLGELIRMLPFSSIEEMRVKRRASRASAARMTSAAA